MKVIYILAQGHTGSTLADCILGTHPEVVSSGELLFLGWQFYRNNIALINDGDAICTCGQPFDKCEYWSKVVEELQERIGVDLLRDPVNANLSYFGRFSYRERGGFKVGFLNKLKRALTHYHISRGRRYSSISKMIPEVERCLSNNWALYRCMADIAGKPVVVDSSKDPTIALLLQQQMPEDVLVLFLHRRAEGLLTSIKKRFAKRGIPVSLALPYVIFSKFRYERRVKRYKRRVSNLSFIDVNYEDYVRNPSALVTQIVERLGLSPHYNKQEDRIFEIDPSKHHIVAGNPMRFKGPQEVKYDDRWKKSIKKSERFLLKLFLG